MGGKEWKTRGEKGEREFEVKKFQLPNERLRFKIGHEKWILEMKEAT